MVLRNTPKVAKKSKRPRTFQKLEKALDSGLFATYSIFLSGFFRKPTKIPAKTLR